jgi:hypothetical protein
MVLIMLPDGSLVPLGPDALVAYQEELSDLLDGAHDYEDD